MNPSFPEPYDLLKCIRRHPAHEKYFPGNPEISLIVAEQFGNKPADLKKLRGQVITELKPHHITTKTPPFKQSYDTLIITEILAQCAKSKEKRL